MPNKQLRRRTRIRTCIGIIAGGIIAVTSILVGILDILNGSDIFDSATLYIPGSIAGILVGGFIGGFSGVLGVIFVISSLLGLIHFFVNIASDSNFGYLNITTNGLAAGVASLIAFAAVVRFLISRVTKFGDTRSDWHGGAATVSVRLASQLLPAKVREEYIEEWRAWLRDLRISGEPWHRRFIELLSIVLIAAPRLAVSLRLRHRRAAD